MSTPDQCRQWRLRNRDKKRKYQREWKKRNAEKWNAYERKRRAKNVEHFRKLDRLWRLKHLEKERERGRLKEQRRRRLKGIMPRRLLTTIERLNYDRDYRRKNIIHCRIRQKRNRENNLAHYNRREAKYRTLEYQIGLLLRGIEQLKAQTATTIPIPGETNGYRTTTG